MEIYQDMLYIFSAVLNVMEFVHSQNCGQCTSIPYAVFDDHVCPSYQLWTRTNSLTVAGCSADCYMHVRCRSFTFNGATSTCIGYASSMSTPPRMGAVTQVGARTYLTCKAPHAIGHPCVNNADCHVTSGVCSNGACDCAELHNYDIKTNACIEVSNLLDEPCAVDSDCSLAISVCKSSTSRCSCNYGNIYNQSVNQCTASPDLHSTTCSSNSDCSVANSICRSGSCVCDVGYSFNKEENQCDQFCTVYGDSYAGYVDVGVGGCNLISVTASTAEDCWKTCTSQTGMLCKNAEYYGASGSCMLCDKAWFELSPGSRLYSDPGWTTYTRNCGDSTKLLGHLCGSNTDCSASNFICRSGTCVCDIGYSFKSDTNECVQLCSTYGNTYVGHKDVGVENCNTVSTTTTTAQACWERCTTEAGLCKNAEYHRSDGTCLMCDQAWFDLSPGSRLYVDNGWTIYFRNCA